MWHQGFDPRQDEQKFDKSVLDRGNIKIKATKALLNKAIVEVTRLD